MNCEAEQSATTRLARLSLFLLLEIDGELMVDLMNAYFFAHFIHCVIILIVILIMPIFDQ